MFRPTSNKVTSSQKRFSGGRLSLALSISKPHVKYTVSQKNRTPATFSNNSNSPGSIAINFNKNNRWRIST